MALVLLECRKYTVLCKVFVASKRTRIFQLRRLIASVKEIGALRGTCVMLQECSRQIQSGELYRQRNQNLNHRKRGRECGGKET